MGILELIFPALAMAIMLGLAFFQAEAGDITDLIGKMNTPLSVGITLWFCKVIFSAWREDAAKAREDSKAFFEVLKSLITSLEAERKTELQEMTDSFDKLANSIDALVAKGSGGG